MDCEDRGTLDGPGRGGRELPHAQVIDDEDVGDDRPLHAPVAGSSPRGRQPVLRWWQFRWQYGGGVEGIPGDPEHREASAGGGSAHGLLSVYRGNENQRVGGSTPPPS